MSPENHSAEGGRKVTPQNSTSICPSTRRANRDIKSHNRRLVSIGDSRRVGAAPNGWQQAVSRAAAAQHAVKAARERSILNRLASHILAGCGRRAQCVPCQNPLDQNSARELF